MGSEHPISWCQDYDGGRSWYTGMGHTDESFSDPSFLTHLLGGIRTAAGVEKADCAATLTGSFEKVTLDDNTANRWTWPWPRTVGCCTPTARARSS